MSFALPVSFVVAMVADGGLGQPVLPALTSDWQASLPGAASPVMGEIAGLFRLLCYVVAATFVATCAAVLWCLVRYHRRLHPVARQGSHNALLQASWVFFPAVVLVLIAIPSLRLVALETAVPPADVVASAIGRIGAWSYEYPNAGDVRFDSRLLDRATAAAYGQPYLLAVDYPLEVPVNKTVELRVTSADVVHSWSVPALGVRVDAVPGRINRVWFKPTRLGIYYGQCSEMCGARKDLMPIAVKVVSWEEYQGWLTWAQGKFAAAPPRGDMAALSAAGGRQ